MRRVLLLSGLAGLATCSPSAVQQPPVAAVAPADSTSAVVEFYEVPQGLLLEFRTERGLTSVPFIDQFVLEVDRVGRRLQVRLPEGLLDS